MEGWVGLAVWGDKEIYWYDLHEESNPAHSHGSVMVNYYAPVDFKIHCRNLFSSNRLGKIALLYSCVLYLKTKVEWKYLHNQGLIGMFFFLYKLNLESNCLRMYQNTQWYSNCAWHSGNYEVRMNSKCVCDILKTHTQSIRHKDKYSQHSSIIWPVG